MVAAMAPLPALLKFLPLLIMAAATGCADHQRTRNVIFTPPDWPARVPADLYRPEQDEPAPAVLLLHGGGWPGGDTRWHMNATARKLAKRGYFVMNATYRQSLHWSYPAPLEDVQEALRWMRENAGEQGIDPNRIAVFGYSAGGYLGTLAALKEGPRGHGVKAIVAGGSPLDMSLYPNADVVARFFGGKYDDIPEVFAEASPVNHVKKNSAPVFLYHGWKDVLVQPEHTLRLHDALVEQNVPHEIFWLRKRGHITAFLMPSGAVDAAIDFLDDYVKPLPASGAGR